MYLLPQVPTKNKVVEYNFPKGSEILNVDTHVNKSCMWVLETESPQTEKRHIIIPTTDELIGDDVELEKYLGTLQLKAGREVYHVFLLKTLTTKGNC